MLLQVRSTVTEVPLAVNSKHTKCMEIHQAPYHLDDLPTPRRPALRRGNHVITALILYTNSPLGLTSPHASLSISLSLSTVWMHTHYTCGHPGGGGGGGAAIANPLIKSHMRFSTHSKRGGKRQSRDDKMGEVSPQDSIVAPSGELV